MSKILIDDIKAQFASTNSINLRFGQVVDEFNDKVLYRDNPVGEPNNMLTDLDLGGNDIVNIGELFKGGEPIIIPDLVWGNILGNIEDQLDLWNILVDHDARITANADVLNLLDPEYIQSEFDRLDADIAFLSVEMQTTKGRVSVNEDDIRRLFNLNLINVGLISDLDDRLIIEEGISADHEIRITTNEGDISALEGSRLTGVGISSVNHSAVSFVIEDAIPLVPTIALTPEVGTKEPFALVKLDASGLIPNELLPFGGAYNSKGVFTVAADPGPYDNPDSRGLGPHANGDFYSIGIPSGQTEGTVLVNTEGVGGPEVPVIVEAGDALLYLIDPATPALDGWYAVLAQGSGDTVNAPDVGYDPTGNRIIVGTSINVDAALTDLDTLVAKKSGDTFTGDIIFSVEGDGLIGPGGKAVMRTSAGDLGNAVVIGNSFGGLFLDALDDVSLRVEGKTNTFVAGQDYVDAAVAGKLNIDGSNTMTGPLVLAMSNPKVRITSTDNTAAFILFNDDTSTIRSAMRAEPTTGNIGWETRDSAGLITATATLINTGVFETEIATSLTVTDGASAETLTRKDYVDGIKDAMYEAMFPIGAVHIHPNPNGVIPGTWVQLAEGEFLMNTVGGTAPTGGTNSYSLAPAHLPPHTHPATFAGSAMGNHGHTTTANDGPSAGGSGDYYGSDGGGLFAGNGTVAAASAGTPAGSVSVNTDPAHTAAAIENRPLFKGVAIWERTA